MKMAEGGKEHLEVYLKKCSAFVPSRRELYSKGMENVQQESFPVIDFEEINRDIDDIRALSVPKAEKEENAPKYIILGGDYFTKEDFAYAKETSSFLYGGNWGHSV
jgi:hypothetical protein